MSSFPGKMLVLDDEAHVCRLIEQALAGEGLQCASVRSGQEAMQRLLAEAYDVIVLDMSLPGAAGMDVLRFISEHGLPTRAVCLADRGGAWEAAARAAGAYELLRKPFDVSRLTELVLRALSEQPRQDVVPGDGASARGEIARDALTGLPTFAAFRSRVAPIRHSCRQRLAPCAALAIGLDGFAKINSAHGYEFGDWILTQVAGRIHACLEQEGFLARGSGDEFILLLPGYSAPRAGALARRISQTVSAVPVEGKGRQVPVSASVGLAEDREGMRVSDSELLERARAAMKAARAAGGDCVMSYEGMSPSFPGRSRQGGGLDHLSRQLTQAPDHFRQILLESAGALVQTVEAKDPYTRQHSEHVAFYAGALARQVGLTGEALESIGIAALLHDIGKIAVPDSVLTKQGKLSRRDFELIRQHPDVGAAILENISLLKTEARLVRFHHENWDGSGYPTGLAGEAIPPGSRIINLADSIDAMLMQRTYKQAYTIDQMLEELARCAGAQFDPELAPAAAKWCRERRCDLILPDEARSQTA